MLLTHANVILAAIPTEKMSKPEVQKSRKDYIVRVRYPRQPLASGLAQRQLLHWQCQQAGSLAVRFGLSIENLC